MTTLWSAPGRVNPLVGLSGSVSRWGSSCSNWCIAPPSLLFASTLRRCSTFTIASAHRRFKEGHRARERGSPSPGAA